MTGFKCFVLAGALAAALAPASVHAAEVSEDIIYKEESGIDDVVQDEEVDQSSDQDSVQSEVSDDYSDVANDYPVTAEEQAADLPADEPSVSGNEIDYDYLIERMAELMEEEDSSDDDAGIMPLSDYNAYYGSISSTYLEYMRGYLYKLKPADHYVASRVSQYRYIFAYGETLEYAERNFSGTDIYVVTFDTQNNGTFSMSMEGSFSLDPGSYLVYTDISESPYPSLATSSDISLRQIVFVAGIFIVFWTVGQFFERKSVRARSSDPYKRFRRR